MSCQEKPKEKLFLVKTKPFEQWLGAVLQSRGFDKEEARQAAGWAAQTAEYQVETHGARKLLSLLDHEMAKGSTCVPKAQHKVLLSTPSLEVWDGKKKLGPAIARTAQARSVELAKKAGMGIVCVRDCNHFGWGPAYALEHLTDGLLVGNITQGAIPIVTPIGGNRASVGSNAIALAMHTGSETSPLFLWDTGTAAMSWGEVQKLRLEGAKLRPGSCVDSQGRPAVEAKDAVALLPAGTIGNALGIMIELVAANLGAGDPHLRHASLDRVPDGEPNTCVFIFFAVNLSVFDALEFPGGRSRKENVARMVEAIFHENGTARMVGERKWQSKKKTKQHKGLLFSPESIAAFREEAQNSGVAFPLDVTEVQVSAQNVAVAGK